jgi:uncharacterized protein (DUF1015 family)
VAEISPFQGIRYNQAAVADLEKVICPPYDIISTQLRQELHHRSEYNFVRLEDGWELPQDTATNSKYTRAAATLEQWLKTGILKHEETPALYIHDHYFTHQGRPYRRRGLTGRIRLTDWEDKVVRPHEGTLRNAKSDRLSLLWALQANTSPILVLYEDMAQQIAPVLAAEAERPPVVSTGTLEGEKHDVWAVTAPEAIAQITRCLAEQPLYIADGHHRYESALNYQRERHACATTDSGDEPFDYVMMNLVDFADPGLLILPPHRLVKGISPTNMNSVAAQLELFFDIERLPLAAPDAWPQITDFLVAGTDEVRLILYGPDRFNFLELRLRDPAAASQMMPYFHSDLYKGLAVSVVDHVLLEKLLGLESESEAAVLGYSYDMQEAVQRVAEQEYQLALLLSPIEAGIIKAIADSGDRMPRKSTYFYPKVPSGLVFYRMV